MAGIKQPFFDTFTREIIAMFKRERKGSSALDNPLERMRPDYDGEGVSRPLLDRNR